MRSTWPRRAVPVLLLASGLAMASSGGPPASRTGAPAVAGVPAEATCAGCHSGNPLNAYEWDGADDRGAPLPAGVYVARLAAPGCKATQRVTLVR